METETLTGAAYDTDDAVAAMEAEAPSFEWINSSVLFKNIAEQLPILAMLDILKAVYGEDVITQITHRLMVGFGTIAARQIYTEVGFADGYYKMVAQRVIEMAAGSAES